MAVPASVVGDLFEMRIYTSNDGGQIAINTIHYVLNTLINPTFNIQDLADGFAHTIKAEFLACVSDEAEVIGYSARRIGVGRETLEYFNTSEGGLGTFTGEVLPGIVAGMLTLRTDQPGPRFRGRLFMPFPSENANDSPGQPSTAYVTALSNFGGNCVFPSDFDTVAGKKTGSFQGVIYHRSDKTFTRITSFVPRTYWSRHKTRANYSPGDRPPV